MFRNSQMFKFSAMRLMLMALALPAAAQKVKESGKKAVDQKKLVEERRPIILVGEVVKRDADAKKEGARRLVPVDFRWQTKLPDTAKLIELKAVLRTANTDGKTSLVEEILPIEDFKPGARTGGTLRLPMDEGVFAKSFNLTLNARFRVADQIIAESASKSGSFPLPVGVVERKK
ncbi:MAG: hypothetical protein ACREEM_10290 [Blastocatellia bacterium]